MAVNKVEYGGKTLVDLTSDTVTPETLAAGVTAHNKRGEQIVGTFAETAPSGMLWLGSFYSWSFMNNADVTNSISYKPGFGEVSWSAPQPMAISLIDEGMGGSIENRVYYYNSLIRSYDDFSINMYFIATTVNGSTSKLTLKYTYADDAYYTLTKITASIS